MSTPPRKFDPSAEIPRSVYAAAKAALEPVSTLRSAVANSALDEKLPKVRDGIMRGTAFLLNFARQLLDDEPSSEGTT